MAQTVAGAPALLHKESGQSGPFRPHERPSQRTTYGAVDLGTNNEIHALDMQTRKRYRKVRPLESIAVGASPFTYTNTNTYNVAVAVSGGTGNVLTSNAT